MFESFRHTVVSWRFKNRSCGRCVQWESPWAEAAAIHSGVLLWFAVSFALRVFRVQWSKNGRRPRARGDGARPPANEGVAEASPRGLEHADADALRPQLLALFAAADAEAQEKIAPEKRPKGVLRRPRCVTFAPQLELEVEIEPDGDQKRPEHAFFSSVLISETRPLYLEPIE